MAVVDTRQQQRLRTPQPLATLPPEPSFAEIYEATKRQGWPITLSEYDRLRRDWNHKTAQTLRRIMEESKANVAASSGEPQVQWRYWTKYNFSVENNAYRLTYHSHSGAVIPVATHQTGGQVYFSLSVPDELDTSDLSDPNFAPVVVMNYQPGVARWPFTVIHRDQGRPNELVWNFWAFDMFDMITSIEQSISDDGSTSIGANHLLPSSIHIELL